MTNKEKLQESIIQKLIEIDNSIEEDNIHKLEEMSEIGRQNDFIIKVFGKEGYIPHFHIYMSDGRLACLQFKTNAYFAHNKYKDKLNNKELKQIMNYLNQPNNKFKEYSNWEMAKYIWNINNTDKNKQLDDDLQMPNYNNPEYIVN